MRRRLVLGLLVALGLLAVACMQPAAPHTGVPSVVGLTTREADLTLRRAGLLLEVDPKGGGNDKIVLAQAPSAGSPFVSGDVVTVEARCFAAPCPFPGEGMTIYDPCTCAAR